LLIFEHVPCNHIHISGIRQTRAGKIGFQNILISNLVNILAESQDVL